MSNAGVGPAIIRSFHVHVDGKPVKSWFEMMRSIGFNGKFAWHMKVPSPYSSWLPGEPKKIFWVITQEALQMLKANADRITVGVCYCSIYDDCWFRTNTAIEPQPNTCRADFPPAFGAGTE
jgi:hypothetical protein